MIEIINTIDASIAALMKNTNTAMSSPGYDYGQTLLMAINQLGYGHPRVQEFLRAHLTTPTACPTFAVQPTRMRLNGLPSSLNRAGAGNPLEHFTSVLEHSITTSAIRIDGKDVPNVVDGRRHWNTQALSTIQLRRKYVPEAFEPGTHTIELDRMIVLLPDGVASRLDKAYWPRNVISHSDTITCEYTVQEPPTANP